MARVQEIMGNQRFTGLHYVDQVFWTATFGCCRKYVTLGWGKDQPPCCGTPTKRWRTVPFLFFFFLCALLFFISAKMDEKFAFQHWCKCFYCWWMVGVVCGIISMVGGTALCCMEVGVNETCCPTVVAVTSSVWNFAAWRFWIPLLTLICF